MPLSEEYDRLSHDDLLVLCNNFGSQLNRRVMTKHVRLQGIFISLLSYHKDDTGRVERIFMDVLIRTQLN